MAQTIQSDTSILDVNLALFDAVRNYIDPGVSIIFDLPLMDKLPSEPTLSFFLYQIHEDLQLRTAQTRTRSYNETTNKIEIAPLAVNINCNYIITYWDVAQAGYSGDSSAIVNNESMIVMNQVVNALINNRQLPNIPGAYTKMLPPEDELNSLGNFWQSLGNKPRLSLHASVSVPVSLTDFGLQEMAVDETEVDMSVIPFVSG